MQAPKPNLSPMRNSLSEPRVNAAEAETPQSRMERYYAERAPEYDRIYLKPERQTDLRAIEAWLPLRFRHARVLEIACGTGYWTQFIAPFAAQLVALDAAAQTLEIARRRVTTHTVEFRLGDAYQLDDTLGQFDAAFAGFWFSHIPKSRRREFLRGLNALLKPGATVVLLDNRYVDGSSSPICDQDAEGNSYQSRTLEDGSSHRILKNFPCELELQSMLEGLGAAGTLTQWPYYWAFEYRVI